MTSLVFRRHSLKVRKTKLDTRPLFLANINNTLHTCLLDTGANLPAFYGSKVLFDGYFSGNATKIATVNITTAGNIEEECNLYRLRKFVMKDDVDRLCNFNSKSVELEFYNMHIIHVNAVKKRPYTLLLSSAMFTPCRLTLDMQSGIYEILTEGSKIDIRYNRDEETIESMLVG